MIPPPCTSTPNRLQTLIRQCWNLLERADRCRFYNALTYDGAASKFGIGEPTVPAVLNDAARATSRHFAPVYLACYYAGERDGPIQNISLSSFFLPLPLNPISHWPILFIHLFSPKSLTAHREWSYCNRRSRFDRVTL